MEIFAKFVQNLKASLANQLPGKNAQLLMSSSQRLLNSNLFINISKKSSVLLMLYPDNECVKIVFIQRPKYIGVHSGQVSLPGGKFMKSDITNKNTALRETMEETGVAQDNINIIGQLTELYIPPSNFLVYPFVGYLDSKPIFDPDKKEVSSIIEANVFDFIKEENMKLNGSFDGPLGIKIKMPYYLINDKIIWGATAMIMSEFVEIIKRFEN